MAWADGTDPGTLVRRFFEEVINQGRLELCDVLLAEDFSNGRTALDGSAALAYGVGAEPLRRQGSSGRHGFREGLKLIRSAFPDYRNDIEELVVEGEKVAGRWVASGTHTGEPFLGIPPRGRRFQMVEAGIMRVRDGQLASFWGVGDELGLLHSLGALAFVPGGTHDG